jgi:hypothetical protein
MTAATIRIQNRVRAYLGRAVGRGSAPILVRNLTPSGPEKQFFGKQQQDQRDQWRYSPCPRVLWEVSNVIELGNLPGEGQSLSP